MAQWYPVYDDATKDVEAAAFYADPNNVTLASGKSLGSAQDGDIPNPLKAGLEDALYAYNTSNNTVEAK